jgi:hypothetical protein
MNHRVAQLFKCADYRSFAGTWRPGYDIPVCPLHERYPEIDFDFMVRFYSIFGTKLITELVTGKNPGFPLFLYAISRTHLQASQRGGLSIDSGDHGLSPQQMHLLHGL